MAPIEQAMTLASAHGHAHDVDLIADYVEILVAAGHDARARDVAEAVPPASPDLPVAARARALVTDGQEGLALLDVACTAPDPFDAARGHLLLGRRLRRAGLRRRARTHLDEAAKIFDGLGAAAWASSARTELASRGAQTTRAPLAQLTAAELRIAVLVAEGRPTRDVAGLLFLSSKTVEFHLSSIYRKLGVANRTALAVYMSTQHR